MKNQIRKFITLFYKKEIETNDSIRWDCFYDILGKDFDKGVDIYPEEIFKECDNKDWTREVDHIKIDDVIEILKKMKKIGCNYVEIMHHCDHNSYVFNGIEIKESTPDEIENQLLKEKKRKEKSQKITELEKQIQQISKEE